MAPRKAATIPTILPVETFPFPVDWSPLLLDAVPDLPPLDEASGITL